MYIKKRIMFHYKKIIININLTIKIIINLALFNSGKIRIYIKINKP
jgi:hypothetical protein